MTNEESVAVSAQREDLHDWIVTRFRILMDTDCVDTALIFADEWFEWLDPDSVNTETTLYFNEDELKGLYEQVRE
jgi:hypothetical protein